MRLFVLVECSYYVSLTWRTYLKVAFKSAMAQSRKESVDAAAGGKKDGGSGKVGTANYYFTVYSK